MRKIVMVLLGLAVLSACGGGGSDSSGSSATTRAVAGSFSQAGAMVAKATVPVLPQPTVSTDAGSCSAAAGTICRVIATSTDGTMVMDENLGDCAFSLPLVIGKSYVISVVGTNPATGACDTFLASLKTSAGSLFAVAAGDAVDLGTVSVTGGVATFTGTFGGVEGCAAMGFDDVDGDGFCDGWDGELPGSDDFAVTACSSNSDCASGEICTACGGEAGYCIASECLCGADDECGAGMRCVADLCDDPKIGYCDYVDAGESECTADADCSWLDASATCVSGFCEGVVSECSDSDDCKALYEGENKMICTDGTCGAAALADLAGTYAANGEGTCAMGGNILRAPQLETVAVASSTTLNVTGTVGSTGILCVHQQTTVTPTLSGHEFVALVAGLIDPTVNSDDCTTGGDTLTFSVGTYPFTLNREVTDSLGSLYVNDCWIQYEKQ